MPRAVELNMKDGSWLVKYYWHVIPPKNCMKMNERANLKRTTV